jgi:hypothetical protein
MAQLAELYTPLTDEIRGKILTLLDQHRILTIATLRPDGWPHPLWRGPQ